MNFFDKARLAQLGNFVNARRMTAQACETPREERQADEAAKALEQGTRRGFDRAETTAAIEDVPPHDGGVASVNSAKVSDPCKPDSHGRLERDDEELAKLRHELADSTRRYTVRMTAGQIEARSTADAPRIYASVAAAAADRIFGDELAFFDAFEWSLVADELEFSELVDDADVPVTIVLTDEEWPAEVELTLVSARTQAERGAWRIDARYALSLAGPVESLERALADLHDEEGW